MVSLQCNSCKKEIDVTGGVKFLCPNCGKSDITRCKHCRKIAAKYVCKNCSFSGPN
ncbi:MAG: zinc finger domain-containing protein [archaeon]